MALRILLALLLAVCLAGQDARPQILCLHSYHKGPWTDELMRGYEAGLGDAAYDLVVEYMDVKRDESPEYLALLERVLARKHRASRFAAVIASDDAAFRFALRLQDGILAGAPLVFCGVNDWDPALIAGRDRVTGVVEHGDFAPTLTLALQARPRMRTLYVLTDSTATAATNLAELRIRAATALPGIELRIVRDLDLAGLGATLAAASPDDAAFFISWWKDPDGRTLLPADVGPSLRTSAIPVFGRVEWMIGRGEVGGVCITGLEHGRIAGAMARRILAGEPIAAIPVYTGSTNEWLFDWEELRHHRIPDRLVPDGARVVNRPDDPWQRHRAAIIGFCAAIVVLMAMVAALATAMIRERRVRRALAEREAELQALFDQSTQLAGRLDPQGRLVAVNAAAMAMIGASSEQVLGRPFWDCPWWIHDPALQQRLRQAVAEVAAGASVRFPATHLDRDGRTRHIDFSLKPLRGADGGVIGLLPEGRDETERIELAKRRHEAERLESLGQLAGGIAHDFNNQLSCILGFAEILSTRLQDPALATHARAIVTAAEHSAGLTRQMLAFARRGGAVRAIDLHRTVGEAVGLLRAGLGKGIRLDVSLAAARSTVVADPALLANAILNLAINARDAMPEGGRLSITTADAALPGAPAIRISVSDSGIGMSPEIRARIFEPFFTTKGAGRGTGLGLAAVHGTVMRLGGTIAVESEPGRGSTFTLLLPLADVDVPTPTPAMAPRTRLAGRALVVDDEAEVRRLAGLVLSEAGMAVETADGGAEAVRLAEAGGRWDLVVLDMLMPDMDGAATFAALRRIQPGVPVILASGFAPEDLLQPLLAAGGARFIAKPFAASALVESAVAALTAPSRAIRS